MHLIFEDTPFNDFTSLAQTISKHFSPSSDRRLSLFTSMVPVGFFQQVVPDGSVDVGFSWSSLSYLSDFPNISLDATASPAEFIAARHEALATAGHTDLVRLLRLRAREIRSGGYFIAGIGGIRPAGEPDEPPSNTGFQPFQSAMKKMVESGTLKMEELMQMALFPSTERTVEEIRAALDETTSLWEVETLKAKLIEHPAWAPYQAALAATGGDAVKKKAARYEYATQVVVNLISASGWFWVDTLKKTRGQKWSGGDAFLEELTNMAVEECVKGYYDMKVEIWYNYVRLRRTDSKEGI